MKSLHPGPVHNFRHYYDSVNVHIRPVRVQPKILMQHSEGVYSHNSVLSAYNFLKENPDIEVSDAFYGESHPFFYGQIVGLSNQTSFVSCFKFSHLSESLTLKKLGEIADFVLTDDFADFETFMLNAVSNSQVVTSVSKYHFATSTFAELQDRVSLFELMSL